jgi:hypothetical protein
VEDIPMLKLAWVASLALLWSLLGQGCSHSTVAERPARNPRPEADLMADLGEMRPPAKDLERNENVPIGSKEGLQSRKQGFFEHVTMGKPGDKETRYLWTIDKRGINCALARTPFPTPRGHITHTNISPMACFAGEAWFTAERKVTINAHSGRFGDKADATETQYEAAAQYWERLGYVVTAIPLGQR